MDTQWHAMVWAGFIATTLAMTFAWMAHSLRLLPYSPTAYLGCLLLDNPRRPLTDTLGFILAYASGSVVLPVLYAWVLDALGDTSWMSGLITGGVHGLLVVAALPLFGTISACVRRGNMPRPGRFGTGWGWPAPLTILAGHLVYGGVAGAILAAM